MFKNILLGAAIVASLSTAGAVGAQTVELAYDPDARRLTITLPEPLADGASLPDWLTQVGNAPEGARRLEGALPDLSMAKGTMGATDTEAFVLGALDWLPARDADRIRLSAPASHRGVAARDLLEETLTEEFYSATFDATGGLANLDVMFGPYVIGEAEAAGTRLRTYFKSDDAEHSAAYLEAAGDYIERYSREIGPYPYNDFFIVSAPVPVGLNLGNTTFVSDRILGHTYMLGRSLGHEVLHSWWGGGVSIDYQTGNWAEGLTTYQADHALAAERSAEAAAEMRQEWLVALAHAPQALALREFRSAAHDRDQSVGYGKAAMVFHMLRQQIGASAFETGLRGFWSGHRGGRAGWHDLRNSFEAASGQDLGWFFSQWLSRPGLPKLLPVAASFGRDEGLVSLTLEQGDPTYRMQVPVRVQTAAGDEWHVLDFEQRKQRFTIQTGAPPRIVAFDPAFDLAREFAEGELPPVFRVVLDAESVALIGLEASASEKALAAEFFNGRGTRIPAGDPLPPEANTLFVTGSQAEIASVRALHLRGSLPEEARQGRARAWVERDRDGRVWLFASSDDPARLSANFAALRYYSKRSFLVVPEEGRPRAGRWTPDESPMSLSLN